MAEGGEAQEAKVHGSQAGITVVEAQQQASQPQAPQAQLQAQVQLQPQVPQPDEATRQKLAQVLGDILVKAQELGFELATLDPGQLGRCPGVKPVIDKARDLIRSLKELFSLRRSLAV